MKFLLDLYLVFKVIASEDSVFCNETVPYAADSSATLYNNNFSGFPKKANLPNLYAEYVLSLPKISAKSAKELTSITLPISPQLALTGIPRTPCVPPVIVSFALVKNLL